MTGLGYDSHKFSDSGKLIIGGIEVSDRIGVLAHSDGDVLIHALIDALFGAAGMGDIGEHYPDTNPDFKDANSADLLMDCISKLESRKFYIINIDATIILETIKLIKFKTEIRTKIAELCGIAIEQVNIKAKTNEKMGFTGRSEGIACFCICQLEKKND